MKTSTFQTTLLILWINSFKRDTECQYCRAFFAKQDFLCKCADKCNKLTKHAKRQNESKSRSILYYVLNFQMHFIDMISFSLYHHCISLFNPNLHFVPNTIFFLQISFILIVILIYTLRQPPSFFSVLSLYFFVQY